MFRFIKITAVCLGVAITVLKAQTTDNQNLASNKGRIVVSAKDSHVFTYADGSPFFWLADTGWEMVHKLNRDEVSLYLKTRNEQGFNVIQTVALSEFKGLTIPNAYGVLPLRDKDPSHLLLTPGNNIKKAGEYDYWDHLDFVIEEADKLGLYIALLPCWGEYVVPREGRDLFHTEKQSYDFGNFIGKRYKNKKNIIWILGGDRLPDEIPAGLKLWRAMAKGLADGTNGVNDISATTDYSTTLISYHCSVSSSKWFQNDAWLDFNMWGSYHDNYSKAVAYEQSLSDFDLSIIKPTINGEPAYEEHPVNWLDGNGSFTAYDVRQIAYWSVLAGAGGHTYGCNPVWQFYDASKEGNFLAHTPWQKALVDEGAQQIKFLKRLILSRPFFNRVPANSLIKTGEGSGADHCVVSKGNGYAFVYLPTGKPVEIALDKIAPTVKAWWFNPRTGESTEIGQYKANEVIAFAPPGISKELNWLKTGRGCDWVLVLDDATVTFSKPGE